MSGPVGFRLMGIVNATPDSFSDGGRFLEPDAAVAHGLELIDAGAAIVDVGGESTRPGAEPVALVEELRRVAPVVEGLAAAATGAQISIDTSKAPVAHAALRAGATLVNDVSALRADPEMAAVVADAGADCCLVHMPGSDVSTMHDVPRYGDVVEDVRAFLSERLEVAMQAGIDERRVLLDPGIGFGKTLADNLRLLARLDELVALGRPVVIGTSRKSFIGRLTGTPAGSERLAGTLASNVLALERGASVFRVHDVAPAREALVVAAATLGERWTASSGTMTPTSWTTT